MPFYCFRCTICGYEFEVYTGLSGEHELEMECPECGKLAKFVFAPFNVVKRYNLDI